VVRVSGSMRLGLQFGLDNRLSFRFGLQLVCEFIIVVVKMCSCHLHVCLANNIGLDIKCLV
jgi:hypothetical protein